MNRHDCFIENRFDTHTHTHTPSKVFPRNVGLSPRYVYDLEREPVQLLEVDGEATEATGATEATPTRTPTGNTHGCDRTAAAAAPAPAASGGPPHQQPHTRSERDAATVPMS